MMARVNPEQWGLDRLTDRERIAHTMRCEGNTYEQIGEALKIGVEAVRKLIKRGVKNGLPQPSPGQRISRAAESVFPVESGQAVADTVENGKKGGLFDQQQFVELCVSKGIPKKMAVAMGGRIASNYAPIHREIKLFKGKALADQLTGKIGMLLNYLDDYAMANMSGKDLAVAIAILVDKVQILEGKPTQIYDVNVSHRIEVLMPQFLAEATRRGITVDGEAKRLAGEEVRGTG